MVGRSAFMLALELATRTAGPRMSASGQAPGPGLWGQRRGRRGAGAPLAEVERRRARFELAGFLNSLGPLDRHSESDLVLALAGQPARQSAVRRR